MNKPNRRFFYFAHRSFKITICTDNRNNWCRAVVERNGFEVADLLSESKDGALSVAKETIDRLYDAPDASGETERPDNFLPDLPSD